MTEKKDQPEKLADHVGILLLSVPFGLWSAFVLTKMWSWFVAPLDVQAIGLWHAAGLLLIVDWLSYRPGAASPTAKSMIIQAVVTLGLLGCGYVFHGLMQ